MRNRGFTDNSGGALTVILVIIFLAAAVAYFLIQPKEPKIVPKPAGKTTAKKAAIVIKPVALAPGVYQVNKDFDRRNSKILERRVVGPTRARLDFASFDGNPILFDPKEYAPVQPEKPVPLAELSFNGSLEPDTLCDRIEQTPLTENEKASPMAWRPATNYLSLNMEGDASLPLETVGANISAVKWNDPDVVPAYQEITRVYLHKTDAGYEMWVRVEFQPWVRFLSGVDDEDGDGFPEFYGRVGSGAASAEIIKILIDKYAGETLNTDAVRDWAYQLGSDWYPQYKTYTRKPEPLEDDMQTGAAEGPSDADIIAKLEEEPQVMIRGAPFEEYLYLVLYVNTTKNAQK